MSEVKQYRKKPVVIEAAAFSGGLVEATKIIDWILSQNGSATWECDDESCRGENSTHYLAIHTLEGRMKANPGDYIIKGVQGEFYPCKPDIFEQTYEDPSTSGSRVVHVLFAGRFVEVVDGDKEGAALGRWVERDDGYWALEISVPE